MSLQETYKEVLFLLPDIPTNQVELSILLIHAINIKQGLVNNGLMENDPDKEWVGIVENWNTNQNGIYSLRYRNLDKENIQFKFIINPDSESIMNINVIRLNGENKIYSFKLEISKLNFKVEEELFKSNIISQYKQSILLNVINKFQPQKQLQKQNLQEEQPQPQGLLWQRPRNDPLQLIQPGSYGRADLDPFPQGPFNLGGNMFGPEQFQQQPPQRNPFAPPGARFDPFGPTPDINPFPDPFPKGGNQFGGGRGGQFPF